MKKIFDIILASLGLIFFLPIFILTAILIKIYSPGAILFKQQRIGKYGRSFILMKFRTMEELNSAHNNFDAGDTTRITSIGKFLRKSKLDELPQLINILKGEMSFVGPRPEVDEWTKVYSDKWSIVHRVKPGITDYASIQFRNEQEILENSDNPVKKYKEDILPHKLSLNIDYVNNRSFLGDLKIILLTIYFKINK